jgi:UDPglucose--hexose-1-phosphate uridylyltransferase
MMEWNADLFHEIEDEAIILPPLAGTPPALKQFQANEHIVQPIRRRKDYLTDTWCHINLARSKRPFAAPQLAHSDNLECLFCPGNEQFTPRDIQSRADTTRTGGNPWSLRAFPNLYPWLMHHGNVVESPQHKISLRAIDEKEQLLALQTIRNICRQFEEAHLHPMVFKNQGWGASTEHTHWQYGALPYLPRRLSGELETARKFSKKWGINAYDAIILSEKTNEVRFIAEDDALCSIVPFAPRTNYEVWLIAKERTPSLTSASEQTITSFSRNLTKLLHVLYHDLKIDSLCATLHQIRDAPDYRLHVEVLPFKHWAGAERGFEEYVVEVTPEDAAAFLREKFS